MFDLMHSHSMIDTEFADDSFSFRYKLKHEIRFVFGFVEDIFMVRVVSLQRQERPAEDGGPS